MRLHELLNELRQDPRSDKRPPLSVRNFNPGNIRVGDDWQGMVGSEGGFVKFDSPEMGARAMAKVLNNYQSKHGLNTLEGIIGRWAPPNENDTRGYVNYVADKVGIDPTQEINFRENPELQTQVMDAMMRMEGGKGAIGTFTPDVLRAGVDLAVGRETSLPSNNQYASAGSFTNYATDATPAITTPAISTSQPSKTIDPRFDMSSLSNVGTTDFNLKRGSSGDNVSQLQTQLQNLGYNIGSTGSDGKFGKNTAAAVRQFQTDYGLQVDSIAGDQTMSALRQASSLKLDPAKSDFSVSSPKLTGGGADISPAIPDFQPPLT